MNAPKVSVLICTNKAPKTTDALLDSIRQQASIKACEVIFVATHLPPVRAEAIKRSLAEFPCVTKYIEENTRGIWPARKRSYEVASGDWLFILDDDNRLGDDAVGKLLRFVERHPEVGGVCPAIVANWESPPPSWLEAFGHLCLSYTESGGYRPSMSETIWPPDQPPQLVPPGGGMIIRRSVAVSFLGEYARIPQFLRESPGLGAEDYPLYGHISTCGLATAYIPDIRVFHHIPQARLTMSFLTRENFRIAYSYGHLRHTGRRLGVIAKLVDIAGFVRFTLASPFFHPRLVWLHLVRLVSFAAGVLDVRIAVMRGKYPTGDPGG
jgi:glycosyltransferase involved in cell wall biosynthesis